jgi:hypothetical protein
MRTKDQLILENLYSNILLNEYSEGFLRTQIKRLKPQAGAYVSEDAIRQMLQRFDQLKTAQTTANRIKELVQQHIESGDIKADERKGPKDIKRFENLKKQPFQVEYYNWQDLETIVHQFRDPSETAALKTDAPKGDAGAEEIYANPENGLHVYFGKDTNACILFKRFLLQQKDAPKDYTWCIANNRQSNLFYRYRFGAYGNKKASVYFIYDESKPSTDKWHVFVIHVNEDNKYLVTSAFNDGDRTIPWNEILKIQPKLKGLEKLFTFRPLTEDEQLYQVTMDANPNDFAGYTSYNVKRAYIETGKKINMQDYIDLPAELQHAYINVRAPGAEDDNMIKRLRKLLELFDDQDKNELNNRYAEAAESGDVAKAKAKAAGLDSKDASEEWIKILCNDPVMAKTKKGQTYKYWTKLVDDTLKDAGAADRADQRKANE